MVTNDDVDKMVEEYHAEQRKRARGEAYQRIGEQAAGIFYGCGCLILALVLGAWLLGGA